MKCPRPHDCRRSRNWRALACLWYWNHTSCRILWPLTYLSRGRVKRKFPYRDCYLSHCFLYRTIFSSCLSPPQKRSTLGGSLGTWLHMKREGSQPRVGIWLWQDFGHSLLLIGAVKRICVCVWGKVFVWIQVLLKVWKHIKDKCQTTVGVGGN